MSMAVQTQTKAAPTIKPVALHTQSGLLQRACACGGTPGVDGECADCRGKRLSSPRFSMHKSEPPEQKQASTLPGFGHNLSHFQIYPEPSSVSRQQGESSNTSSNHSIKSLKGVKAITAGGAATETIKYKPESKDTSPKIVFIQVMREFLNGKPAKPSEADTDFSYQDADTTGDFYHVDYVKGEKDPYYNGDDTKHDIGVQGNATSTPKVDATMTDDPDYEDETFPPGKSTIEYEFRTIAFSAAGADQGTFYAYAKWHYTKKKGTPAVIRQEGTSTDTALPKDKAAINLWCSNHGFTLPTRTPGKVVSVAPCNIPTTAPEKPWLGEFYFEVSSPVLTEADKKKIASIAKTLQSDGASKNIRIDGYASIDGTPEINAPLSCSRAEAIKAELIRNGILPANIAIFAHSATDEFSKTSLEKNRVAIISQMSGVKPPKPGPEPTPTPPEPRKVPTKFKVETPRKGEVEKDGKVKNLEVKVKPTEHETATPKTISKSDDPDDPTFQFTSSAGVQIPTIVHLAGVPQKHDPCDFIVTQVGAKWNWKGLRLGSRLTLGGSTELDLGFNPAFCDKSPWFTPQLQQDILKLVIMKDIWEATFQGTLGLQDDWLKNLGGSLQGGIQLEWHPWGAQKSSWYSKLKFDATGLLIWNFDSKGSTLDLGGQVTVGVEIP